MQTHINFSFRTKLENIFGLGREFVSYILANAIKFNVFICLNAPQYVEEGEDENKNENIGKTLRKFTSNPLPSTICEMQLNRFTNCV